MTLNIRELFPEPDGPTVDMAAKIRPPWRGCASITDAVEHDGQTPTLPGEELSVDEDSRTGAVTSGCRACGVCLYSSASACRVVLPAPSVSRLSLGGVGPKWPAAASDSAGAAAAFDGRPISSRVPAR